MKGGREGGRACLMCPTDQVQVVFCQKFFHDIVAKEIRDAAGITRPASQRSVRIRPRGGREGGRGGQMGRREGGREGGRGTYHSRSQRMPSSGTSTGRGKAKICACGWTFI